MCNSVNAMIVDLVRYGRRPARFQNNAIAAIFPILMDRFNSKMSSVPKGTSTDKFDKDLSQLIANFFYLLLELHHSEPMCNALLFFFPTIFREGGGCI